MFRGALEGRWIVRGLEPVNQPMERENALAVQPIQKITPEAQKKLLEYGEQMNLFAGSRGG